MKPILKATSLNNCAPVSALTNFEQVGFYQCTITDSGFTLKSDDITLKALIKLNKK